MTIVNIVSAELMVSYLFNFVYLPEDCHRRFYSICVAA